MGRQTYSFVLLDLAKVVLLNAGEYKNNVKVNSFWELI